MPELSIKGDAGAVHNELAGEHLVNGLVQVLEDPLDPVVVNLPDRVTVRMRLWVV